MGANPRISDSRYIFWVYVHKSNLIKGKIESKSGAFCLFRLKPNTPFKLRNYVVGND